MNVIDKNFSKPCQTSKMEHFVKIVNGFQMLIIITKNSISDAQQGSEYASDWRLKGSHISRTGPILDPI